MFMQPYKNIGNLDGIKMNMNSFKTVKILN